MSTSRPWVGIALGLWAVGTLGIGHAIGAELPELVATAGMGVNIHFTRGHERDLDMIAAAGFKIVRMDFGWEGIERRKGEYDWSDYDELTKSLEKRGLRPLYILDYSNGLYEEVVDSRDPVTGENRRSVASPQHPDSVAAFARWAAAAAKRYSDRRIIWEIWNEPNISFWKPKPDARQYAALALAASKAIRAADAKATIVGPATSEVPAKFLAEVFATGLLDQFDAVTVHPYRQYDRGPETAIEDYAQLRRLTDKSTPAGRKLPILSGEWGYSTFAGGGLSLQTQAAYLVRQQLCNLYAGVPISIWYDWKDDGPDPKEREHNFGTVTYDLKPKPAYVAAQTLARELAGFRIERRVDNGNPRDWILLLDNGKEEKLAAWTTDEPHACTVAGLGIETARAVAGDGRRARATVANGAVSLELLPLPQYATLGDGDAKRE